MKQPNICFVVVSARPQNPPKSERKELIAAKNCGPGVAGPTEAAQMAQQILTCTPSVVSAPQRYDVRVLHCDDDLVCREAVLNCINGSDTEWFVVAMAATPSGRMIPGGYFRSKCRADLRFLVRGHEEGR